MAPDHSSDLDVRRLQIASFALVSGALMLGFGSLLGLEGVDTTRAIGGGILVFVGGIYVLVALTPVLATRLGYPSVDRIDDLESGTQVVVITLYVFLSLGAVLALVWVGSQ